ncbi:MAG: hypothetical protein IT292_04225 [Deltaproteobacteria bacterium]|nr:hypothetical protein [Deltaproteobacteria bacterium]
MAKQIVNMSGVDKSIRTFLAALIVVCLSVTIVGSAIAGVQVVTIIYRAIVVYLILYAISGIIKRYWASLSFLQQEKTGKK